jgi:hypothetical protein
VPPLVDPRAVDIDIFADLATSKQEKINFLSILYQVTALLSKRPTTPTATNTTNCNSLDNNSHHTNSNSYHHSNGPGNCNGLLDEDPWPLAVAAGSGKSAKKTGFSARQQATDSSASFRGHYRAASTSAADILILDDTVVDRYDLHGVKIETEFSDCDTMLPNGTR